MPKPGDKVHVYNRSWGGGDTPYFHEGVGVIVQDSPTEIDGRYMVRMENGDLVERWIDTTYPAAQKDPAAYVAWLNDNFAKTK